MLLDTSFGTFLDEVDLLAWCSSDGMKISELSEKMPSQGSLEVVVSGEGSQWTQSRRLTQVRLSKFPQFLYTFSSSGNNNGCWHPVQLTKTMSNSNGRHLLAWNCSGREWPHLHCVLYLDLDAKTLPPVRAHLQLLGSRHTQSIWIICFVVLRLWRRFY